MSDFWNYIKGVFNSVEESTPAAPTVHEMIERSEEEKTDYLRWRETLVRRRLVDWLNNQYAIYLKLPKDIDDALDFLHTPSSKGFVMHFHKTQYSRRDVQHFFDYLKERVLQLNYRTQISDARTYPKGKLVETTERHYLKPRLAFTETQKMVQQFGNITIKNILRNDTPWQLTLQATIYKDHNFTEGDFFPQLMDHLLAED